MTDLLSVTGNSHSSHPGALCKTYVGCPSAALPLLLPGDKGDVERPEDSASLTENSKQGPYGDQQVLSFTKVGSGKKKNTAVHLLPQNESLFPQ